MKFISFLNEVKIVAPSFIGFDNGKWEVSDDNNVRSKSDWKMTNGLSSENNWKNFMIDGATEDHDGFLKALKQIVTKHPEFKYFKIKFDGPWFSISDLLKTDKHFDWKDMIFYHGTSMSVWESVRKNGLVPRSLSKNKASYGSSVGAKEGDSNMVYLTTQENLAKFAALDSGKITGTQPIILVIDGEHLDPKNFYPDEDSRASTAEESLKRMGSVAYKGAVSPKAIDIAFQYADKKWV